MGESIFNSIKSRLGGYVYFKKETYNRYSKNASVNYFRNITKNLSDTMLQRAIARQKKALIQANNLNQASSTKEIIEFIENDLNIEGMFNAIAEGVSQGMDNSLAEKFAKIITNTQKYIADSMQSSVTKDGTLTDAKGPTVGNIKQIFAWISAADKLINGSSNANIISKLKSIALTKNPTLLSAEEVATLDPAFKYLHNAITYGFSLDSQMFRKESLQGSIWNIYGKAMGEQFSSECARIAFNKMNDTVLNFEKAVALTSTKEATVKLTGTNTSDQQHRTFKPDFIITDALKVSPVIDGKTGQLSVTVNTNVSNKWSTRMTAGSNMNAFVKVVSGTPIKSYLKYIPTDDTKNEFWSYAANAIVWEGAKNRSDILNALTAAAFDEWLTGTGEGEGSSIDLAQFIMVNNKLYSVLDIIKKVQKDLQSGSPQGVVVNFKNVSEVKKSQNHENYPTYQDAVKRNERAKAVTNALQITAKFNANFLQANLP